MSKADSTIELVPSDNEPEQIIDVDSEPTQQEPATPIDVDALSNSDSPSSSVIYIDSTDSPQQPLQTTTRIASGSTQLPHISTRRLRTLFSRTLPPNPMNNTVTTFYRDNDNHERLVPSLYQDQWGTTNTTDDDDHDDDHNDHDYDDDMDEEERMMMMMVDNSQPDAFNESFSGHSRGSPAVRPMRRRGVMRRSARDGRPTPQSAAAEQARREAADRRVISAADQAVTAAINAVDGSERSRSRLSRAAPSARAANIATAPRAPTSISVRRPTIRRTRPSRRITIDSRIRTTSTRTNLNAGAVSVYRRGAPAIRFQNFPQMDPSFFINNEMPLPSYFTNLINEVVMDYDTLLELDRNNVRQNEARASEDTIRDLGTVRAKKADQEKTCCICISDFKTGEIMRRLPCDHLYHKNCIDKWLRVNAVCPACKRQVVAKPIEVDD